MGRAKALLPFQGEAFLDRLIGTMASVCSSVTVVLGHDAELVRAKLARTGEARFVVNADYEKGQLSSLQCGLRALPNDIDAFAFTPVDYPAFRSETLQLLCDAFDPSSVLAVPRMGDRRGHPVLARIELRAEFLAATNEAREVIHSHRQRTKYVDVDDPGILRDIDDPAAYEELLRSYA